MNLIESDMIEINEELASTYSSKEIIDLGTRVDKYSTKDVVISVALLAVAIAAASGLTLAFAKTIATDVVAASYFLTDDSIYYTSHVNNKMVYLDGEFAYYISTINTYVYADRRRTDLITWSQTSGESLSPMRIEL